MEQLHVGSETESEADRVAGDLALAARDGLEALVDLNEDHGVDLADSAARLSDRVSDVERHASAGK